MEKQISQRARKATAQRLIGCAMLSLLLLAVSVKAQEAQKDVAKSQTTPKGAATTDPNYIIGPQDVLEIDVWQETELTKTIPVRPDGKVSLPLVNDLQAAGLTPTQLGDELTKRLKKFVTDPQVTVIVTAINSQRVYILGEATRPGAYPLLPGMTVLQALSSAGGFTIFADVKKVYVLRKEGGKQEKLPFNYKEVIKGKNPDQNVELKAGDQIVVP
jgi:polysaccharide biosynthesis/export protein